MAALTKHTANAVSFHLKHNNREYDPGKTPKNIEIDPTRTHLNYSLQPSNRVSVPKNSTISQAEKAYYNFRMKQLYHMRRKDLVTAAEWCITMPKELNQTSPEIQRKFFEETYKFCCKKYDERNIIQATVHYDEGVKNKSGEIIAGQPHMHVIFIPTIPVIDKNPMHRQSHFKEKVNAKKALNRTHLIFWHTDYQKWMDKRFQSDTGIRVLVHTGTTPGKNISVAALKAETKLHELQKDYEKQQKKLEFYEKQHQQIQHESPWGQTPDWGSQVTWGNSTHTVKKDEEKIW